jgi:hypothetical protein
LHAQGLGPQPCDLPALRLDFAACGQFGLFCGLSQRYQLSLGLGGALGCILALSLNLLPHHLLAQDLGLQPCDLLALRLDFAACGQLGLFCGLSQR